MGSPIADLLMNGGASGSVNAAGNPQAGSDAQLAQFRQMLVDAGQPLPQEPVAPAPAPAPAQPQQSGIMALLGSMLEAFLPKTQDLAAKQMPAAPLTPEEEEARRKKFASPQPPQQ